MNASPTIELIHRHASVRSYRTDPVSVEQVEAIVAAGQRSSTSSNLQMFSVVAVADQATRQQLAVLCGNQEHIAQAPVFLAWCADLARLDRACQLRGYEQVTRYVESFLLAAVDTSLAMQNAALAAELMGLGMCYIGAIRNRPQEVIDLLELPRLVFPIAGMTLGWPAVEPMVRPRLPLSAVLHWERYDRRHGRTRRWPSTTGPWLPRASTMAGKWRRPARMAKWRTTAGPNTRPAAVSQPARTHLREVLLRQGFALE